MSLPRGVVKDESTGALFMLRSRRELAGWSDDELRMRWRWITALLSPETGGVGYVRSVARRMALRERTALVNEMDRRSIRL